MSKSLHDQIAENLAKKFGTEYKKHKGIDIVTKDKVIEVETTKSGIYQGIKQVKRSSKAKNIAVNDRNIQNALDATEGTGIGVMNEMGETIKRGKRGEKVNHFRK